MTVPNKRLGEIMVSLGFCTGRTMQRVLRKQAKMREAKGYALRIGHMLLEEAAVTEHELATALSNQFKLPLIDLVGRELLVGLMRTIPEPVLDKYTFVPVTKDGSGVVIAVDEVLPKSAIEGLQRAFECPVRMAIVPGSQLLKVQRWCRQHRRRLASGQLDRVTLPYEYFQAEAGDPESTIKPGSITVNSIKATPTPPRPIPAPIAATDVAAAAAAAAAVEGLEESSPSLSGGLSRAERRARRLTERSTRMAPTADLASLAAPVAEVPEAGAPAGLPEPAATAEVQGAPGGLAPGVEPDPEPEPELALAPEPEIAVSLTAGDFPELFDEVPAAATAAHAPESWTEVPSTQLDRLPPLSRLLVARPANLVAMLRELKDGACETLTIAPRGSGADIITADEDGSRISGSLSVDDYPGILDAGLELLDLEPGQVFTRAVALDLQATVDGEVLDYRLTAIPSQPPTLVFSAADRVGWQARRQVREWPFVEGLSKRLGHRRGLVLVTADAAASASGVICGLLSALRRSGLRAALVAGDGASRVREVTTVPVPPERAAEALAPESLLAVCAAGLDVLALDVALTPDQLRAAVPLASADAALCIALRERNTFDAVRALVRAKLSPALVASVLEMAISVHVVDRLCSSCRKETVLTDERIPAPLKTSKLGGAVVCEAAGCALCAGTGVRGTVVLHEVLTWDRVKATPELLTLERKALVMKCFELGLAQPVSVEARKALIAGAISFKTYLKLLGVPGA